MLSSVIAVVLGPLLLFHSLFSNPVFVTALSLFKDVKGMFTGVSSQNYTFDTVKKKVKSQNTRFKLETPQLCVLHVFQNSDEICKCSHI